jgi:hypothetical protein
MANGVETELDLWRGSDSSVAWSRYGPQEIQQSDAVLIAISDAWRQRWEGRNSPTVGAGAVGEANTLRGLFERDQAVFQQRTIMVFLPGSERDDLPRN